MAEAIGAIKEKLQAATLEELPALFMQYEQDERAGVQALLAKGRKRVEAYEKEVARCENLKKYEREYAVYTNICGIDEVGRGPLAGPVVAGAVILPKDCDILYINDSKKLSAKVRDELYDEILAKAISVKQVFVDEKTIDRVNILQATMNGMYEAIFGLDMEPQQVLIDAVHLEKLPMEQLSLIKGDAKSASIAAASIIAKVSRDRLMDEYDSQYPEYGFASNKGYGTAEHVAAIKKYGPCPIHRVSFEPIRSIINDRK